MVPWEGGEVSVPSSASSVKAGARATSRTEVLSPTELNIIKEDRGSRFHNSSNSLRGNGGHLATVILTLKESDNYF